MARAYVAVLLSWLMWRARQEERRRQQAVQATLASSAAALRELAQLGRIMNGDDG